MPGSCERDLAHERIKAGIAACRRRGLPVGRQRIEMDVRPGLAMLREGHSLRETARALGVSRDTLRRRLQEAGQWPVEVVAQRPDPADDRETP